MSVSIRAKYAIHSETFVRCELRLDAGNIDIIDQTFSARCIVRGDEDITLATGTPVVLEKKSVLEFGQFPELPSNGLYTLSTHVVGIRIREGELIHEFAPLTVTPFTERRKQARQSNFFTVQLEQTLQGEFMVTDGSADGLTLFGTRKHAFSGCSVGQQLTVLLAYQGETIPAKATIRHLHYDLTDGKLMIGLAMMGLKKRQSDVIQCLLNPDFVPDAEKQLNTQISADKISAN